MLFLPHARDCGSNRVMAQSGYVSWQRLIGVCKYVIIACILLALFIGTSVSALASDKMSVRELLKFKYSILAVQDLEQQGLLTPEEAETAIAEYVTQASRSAGSPLSLSDILSIPDSALYPGPQTLTPLQQFAGMIDFLRIMLVLGIIAIAGAVGYLFKYYVKKLIQLLKNIPLVAYELVFYATSLGSGVLGWFLSEPMHQYIGLLACLLFVAALGFSASQRRYIDNGFRFTVIVFVVWTPIALLFKSPVIGFLAVGALLTMFSFRVFLTPYGPGYRDEITIRRATIAAFIVLALFIGLRLLGDLLPWLVIFEPGALFLGSLVGYVGLLILSSHHYDKKRYWAFQFVAVTAGVGALFFGSVFLIDELQKIGGTFFVVYCIVKLMEIPTRSQPAFALLVATVSALTIAFCWFALTHQELFQRFLFMP